VGGWVGCVDVAHDRLLVGHGGLISFLGL
jgi:hypothetical protein